MNKTANLLTKYQCRLRVLSHPSWGLIPEYRYEWGTASCKFHLLTEVAQKLVPVFEQLLKRRGLLVTGIAELERAPHWADCLSPDVRTPAGRRVNNLLPGGCPRYLRVYDNGGETADRYTVLFTGHAGVLRVSGRPSGYWFVSMSQNPQHPQGFGQHGFSQHFPLDAQQNRRPPRVGRKNHLGTRITFGDLPEACQRLVFDNYIEIWRI